MTNDVAADLERLICDLADIADLGGDLAARKARRVYGEMRLKYPVSVLDAVEPLAVSQVAKDLRAFIEDAQCWCEWPTEANMGEVLTNALAALERRAPEPPEERIISHALTCPVSKLDFVPDVTPGHKSACTCDFGQRLADEFGLPLNRGGVE